MGTIAYLDTVMRVDSKQLEAGLEQTDRRFVRHGKSAKNAKAANDSLFGSFKSGSGVAGNLDSVLGRIDGRLSGISSGMLGAASAGGVLAAGLGAIVAVGGAAAATIHSVAVENAALGRELQAQAVAANLTVQQIQEIGYATESVGISGEKAGDIFKDFQDKLGDFRSTGGGAFADFFEQVGDKVGLSADALARMSGPEALIAVKKAMDDANVSADRQVFYFEALAGDAARLSPLLAENGKRFREMVSDYRDMDVALSDSEIEKFKEYDQDINNLSLAWDSLTRDAVAPFVGYLGTAVRFMADFLHTSKTERVAELREEISGLDSDISSFSENIEKYGEVAAGVWDNVSKNIKGVVDGGVIGGFGAAADGIRLPADHIKQLQEEKRLKEEELKSLEESLRKAGDLSGEYGTTETKLGGIVNLEQKRLDIMKESVRLAKSRSSKSDSLYSKLFGEKEGEKKNYKSNREFESSAKAAQRLIADGFVDGAKVFLAEAEASYRASKQAGGAYDTQGMKDVILMLRESAGLDVKDIDNPSRNKASKPGGGESYAKVEFLESDRKSIELFATSAEEMNKKVGEFVGAQDEALKAITDLQKPEKVGTININVASGSKKMAGELMGNPDFLREFKNFVDSVVRDTAIQAAE